MRKMQKGRRKTLLTAATTRPTRKRVSDDPPFTHTGIDFAGPLYTSEKGANEEDSKTYVCLFTCASTRAVHLELTKRLSSEVFMLAFLWSTSRRGLPVTLISDNARTFKSAWKDIVRIARAKSVAHYMANNGLTWKFIDERAAWWGGFWERLMQNLNAHSRKWLDELVSFSKNSTQC